MNRRAFLRLAAKGTVAISALRYLPAPPTHYFWKTTRLCGFLQPCDDARLHVGYILGERNDGKFFFSTMVIPEGEFNEQSIDRHTENALRSLNTCLLTERGVEDA